MESLRNINQQFERFIQEKSYTDQFQFNSFLNAFKQAIEKLENIYTRGEIVAHLQHLRVACSKSPFNKRVQAWPRGYQGDFETIEYIMQARNKAREGTFEYAVEDYFLNSDICQQHKNKVARQAELIKEVIREKSDAKIISIGCGTSEDIRQCKADILCSDAEITLVDVDSEALSFSLKRLDGINERVTALHGNIYKLMRSLSNKYDLILIGGVFDYLNDKTIVSILKSLRNNVAEDGKIFFTNIAKNNRYRIFMEYMADWFLIERSEGDLNELIDNADWPCDSCKITKDETGLTHLVELCYAGNVLDAVEETENSSLLVAAC